MIVLTNSATERFCHGLAPRVPRENISTAPFAIICKQQRSAHQLRETTLISMPRPSFQICAGAKRTPKYFLVNDNIYDYHHRTKITAWGGFIVHHKLQTVFGAALLAATAGYSFAQTSTTFNYDNLGRLKSSSNGSYTTKYSIDAADNILSVATTSTGSSSQPGATIVQVTAFGNLRTLANSAGYTGAAAGNFQFVVASNITVVGGLDTGTWPSGSTLSLVVNGNVYGSGGAGGNGNGTGNGSPGAAGGDAVVAHAPITITVNANGSVKAGGGGGGGGGYGYACPGGGGGGGFPNGVGGSGGAQNQTYHCSMPSGSNGTAAGGGAGGTGGGPAGGAGGAPAAAGTNGAGSIGTGGAGGSAGYAVRKNGNAVSVNGGGVVTGTVG